MNESIKHNTKWVIYKFKDEDGQIEKQMNDGADPEIVASKYSDRFLGKIEELGNVACNEGLGELIDIIIGSGSPTAWNAANAYLGVGNGTATANATDTGLSGASKTYMAMESGYPQRTSQTGKWRSSFGTGDANYGWEEYTLVNASSDTGKNLNHKVESKGTKSSGETWTLELQITFS
jgi:hypothetical protein